MIEYIHGHLAELTPTYAVLEATGVGYMINISLNTYSQLSQLSGRTTKHGCASTVGAYPCGRPPKEQSPSGGEASGGAPDVKLLIHEIIREDAHILYGFLTPAEREMFLMLISVGGVGPNTARVILSELGIGEVYNAIVSGDERTLKSAKGVGARVAQRIIVELKDKVVASETLRIEYESSGRTPGKDSTEPQTINPQHAVIKEEAVGALTMLGFSPAPSAKVVTAILEEQPELTVEQVIKIALKNIK